MGAPFLISGLDSFSFSFPIFQFSLFAQIILPIELSLGIGFCHVKSKSQARSLLDYKGHLSKIGQATYKIL